MIPFILSISALLRSAQPSKSSACAQLDPSDAALWFLSAQIADYRNKDAKVIEFATRFLKSHPGDGPTHTLLAATDANRGDLPKAHAAAKKAQELGERHEFFKLIEERAVGSPQSESKLRRRGKERNALQNEDILDLHANDRIVDILARVRPA